MDTLVAYDSQYGNTERIARAVADTAQVTANVRLVRIVPDAPPEIGGVSLLILGCPTQGWRPTPAMRAFLETLAAERHPGLSVACFDTRFAKPRWLTGSAARVMARELRAMGIAPLVPPESFFVAGTEGPLVDGELDRAAGWTHALLAKVDTPEPATR